MFGKIIPRIFLGLELFDSYRNFRNAFREGAVKQTFPVGPELAEVYSMNKFGRNFMDKKSMDKKAFLGPLGAGIGMVGMYGVYKSTKEAEEEVAESLKRGEKYLTELAEEDPYLSQVPKEDLEEYYDFLVQTAPEFVGNKVFLRSTLRQMASYGGIDPQTLELINKAREKYVSAKTKEVNLPKTLAEIGLGLHSLRNLW